MGTRQDNKAVVTADVRLRALVGGVDFQRAVQAALPKHITPERFVRIALTAVNRTPALQECEALPVMLCMVEAAQLGLEMNGPLGGCYVIPYLRNGKQVPQLVLGYKGLMDLAYRSGRVASIYAHCVYEGDVFEVAYGLDQALVHKPGPRPDGAPVTHAYAVAILKDGVRQFACLDRRAIERRRAASKAKSDESPWQQWYEEMAVKTAIKALCKHLMLSPELDRAIGDDDAAEAGAQDLTGVLDTTAKEIKLEEPEDQQQSASAQPTEPEPEPDLEELRDEIRQTVEAAHMPAARWDVIMKSVTGNIGTDIGTLDREKLETILRLVKNAGK